MSYLDYFKLTQEPFSNAPNAHFYYDSDQHSRALVRLSYAAESMKGLAVLIGEIGAGKTTLARRMLDALPEDKYEAALLVIVHGGITASWLLKRIALQLGVERPADEKLRILSQIYQRLVKIHESGKRAVVLIDEAQMLETREIMEEFRGMLNLEIPGHKLVTFVLFGLPELADNLHLDEPLNQRVAVRCRLQPFAPEETMRYIRHRLKLAGARGAIFEREALLAVHQSTGGVPRLINTVCDNVLFEAFMAKTDLIPDSIVTQVAADLDLVIFDDPDQLEWAEAREEPVAAAPEKPSVARPMAAARTPSTAPRLVAASGVIVSESEEFDLESALAEPTPVQIDPEPTPASEPVEEAAPARVFEEIDTFDEDEELEIPRIDALDDIDSILDQLDDKG